MANKGNRGPQPTTAQRSTKAERKAEARRERLEIQRRQARARRNRAIALVVVPALVVGVVVVASLLSRGGGQTASRALPGTMTGPQPWPNNTADLGARLTDLALPPAGGGLHIHSHLDIVVEGSAVTVPADIGIGGGAESPVHTHDTTGVVHVESANPSARFTLGEFFGVWGLRLTSSCIGGYCDAGGKLLRSFVDGKPYPGNPASISLADHEDIVLTFGTADQVPKPLPTYDWSTFKG